MKLTTTVYKYKRSAPWLILLLVTATALLFIFSSRLNLWVSVLGVVLLFSLAVYAALRPKSLFSIRSADERLLTFTPDELIWGTVQMPIQEVEKLKVYIHAFNTFKHSASGNPKKHLYNTEYGDRNSISFVYRGTSHSLIFYLDTFEHYDILIKILQSWRGKGIELTARSAFSDSYIRKNVQWFG
ncbi:hypothetical protein HHL16_01520 [Pseudoflavitalea sp. G-6-1-2]|uniref:hypothetical protein n=1 Tax=Pseudoflavitalea sp. G-6-1-2 TaxID=2728841 RepID=UPI00146CC8D3|nr:hypothetical protein [Pseudoflavitalea sp. G-6-1-2]NML19527.1 hypothetical protein [Pseudoflavitalea sp. G-6-1-2]